MKNVQSRGLADRQYVQEYTVSGFRIFPAEQSKYSIFDFRNFGLFMGPNEGITSYCTFLYRSLLL